VKERGGEVAGGGVLGGRWWCVGWPAVKVGSCDGWRWGVGDGLSV